MYISDTDQDECIAFNPCDQLCLNTFGSFECSCMDGYELQDDMTSCEGMLIVVQTAATAGLPKTVLILFLACKSRLIIICKLGISSIASPICI